MRMNALSEDLTVCIVRIDRRQQPIANQLATVPHRSAKKEGNQSTRKHSPPCLQNSTLQGNPLPDILGKALAACLIGSSTALPSAILA